MPREEAHILFDYCSGSMITNLDKSLTMVEEAKKSKIARLRYSRRLEDLMVEVQAVKQAVKMEEAKLARIQPEIQASHEIIISLKQKRNKLRNAALDLGKGLKGPDYRYFIHNNNYIYNYNSSSKAEKQKRGLQMVMGTPITEDATIIYCVQFYYSFKYFQVVGPRQGGNYTKVHAAHKRYSLV